MTQWGLPNGYVLGQEASGAFIGGLRYGDGRLSAASKAARAIYRPSMPSDLGDLKYCASFGRGSNFASMPDPMHFIFAV